LNFPYKFFLDKFFWEKFMKRSGAALKIEFFREKSMKRSGAALKKL